MQPEMKVPLGVAEAEALAKWLQQVATDYGRQVQPGCDHIWANHFRKMEKMAREWARVVKPVAIKRRGRP